MLTMIRRMALVVTLMFWQGGFMFYGAVVVPVGTDVLGSHRDQGFVTRSVTNYLNGAGAIALAVCCWEFFHERRTGAKWNRVRWILWATLVASLALQVWLHQRLDERLDLQAHYILDRPGFYRFHQWYLIVSTIQWIGAIVLTGLTVWTWKEADAACCEGGRG
jgi:hypothetical protein